VILKNECEGQKAVAFWINAEHKFHSYKAMGEKKQSINSRAFNWLALVTEWTCVVTPVEKNHNLT